MSDFFLQVVRLHMCITDEYSPVLVYEMCCHGQFSRLCMKISGVFIVFVVLLASKDPDGQAHDQRGRNGFAASGEPVLYPSIVSTHLLFYIV